jgi:pyruvate ferredoxin oxidoreductase alpha subunit
MMTATRSIALPWNIYGDQRDSLSLLESGWIQAYAKDGQEALDLALLAYRIAEDPGVRTPFMVNLDGFHLSHTYVVVEAPDAGGVEKFLPPFATSNKMSANEPKNLAFTAGPDHNAAFIYKEHKAMLRATGVISDAEREFAEIFGRRYTGLIEKTYTNDAEVVLITLGSVSALAGDVTERLRAGGVKAGLVRIRYMRPFPAAEIADAVKNARAVAVLEKDISFGYEGVVFSNVNSALQQAGVDVPTVNYVGGFGGRFITGEEIEGVFHETAKDGKPGGNHASAGAAEPQSNEIAWTPDQARYSRNFFTQTDNPRVRGIGVD